MLAQAAAVERHVFALGIEASTHVLDDEDVTAAHKALGLLATLHAVVGRACEHHGKGAIALRKVGVRSEKGAVAHGVVVSLE